MKKAAYKMTPKVKEYLIERLGKQEATRLMYFMEMGNYILLTGPAATGKSTIYEVLSAIGYPYVIDEGACGVIRCKKVITGKHKSHSDILADLGLDQE